MRPVPRIVPRILAQSLFILALSAMLAFGVNALRPDGLPLVQAAPSAVQLPQNGGEIGIKDAALLFVSGRAVFLDARSQFEFEQGHIQGALSLPPRDFAARFPGLKPRLGGKEAVITYCDGELCQLSIALAEQLRAAGIANVFVLKNGWTLWNAEKLPVAKGPAGQAGQTSQTGQTSQMSQMSQMSPAGQKGKSSGLKALRPETLKPDPLKQDGLCTDCAN